MTVKYTPEVKQILKAAGYSEAEIKTMEVKDAQDVKNELALNQSELPSFSEKFDDEALKPMRIRQAR